MKKSVFLITGGCGFIGSALIRNLLLDDSNTIVNIDKLTYASNLSSVGNTKDKNYFFYNEDIVNNIFLEKVLVNHKPDYVIHLAAESHVDNSFLSPLNFTKTNTLGAHAFFLECIKNKVKKIYFIKPMWFQKEEDKILDGMFDQDCVEKINLKNVIFTKIKNC